MHRFRISKRKITLIISLFILLISAVYQSLQTKIQKPPTEASITPTLLATTSAYLVKVSKVIDGDTIELENGQKVRYIGIDAPELHHPKKKLECFGKEARDKNKELVEGKFVRLEKDVSETDRYSRLLRYIYVSTTASPSGNPSTSSGQLFVNETLVGEGYAYAATFPPDVKYSNHFTNLENQARENNRGLWNKCK